MSEGKNARDTQFQGFADLLLHELDLIEREALSNGWNTLEVHRRWRKIIARRAYDLVEHTLEHAPVTAYDCYPWDIPDLAELPKEQDEP